MSEPPTRRERLGGWMHHHPDPLSDDQFDALARLARSSRPRDVFRRSIPAKPTDHDEALAQALCTIVRQDERIELLDAIVDDLIEHTRDCASMTDLGECSCGTTRVHHLLQFAIFRPKREAQP